MCDIFNFTIGLNKVFRVIALYSKHAKIAIKCVKTIVRTCYPSNSKNFQFKKYPKKGSFFPSKLKAFSSKPIISSKTLAKLGKNPAVYCFNIAPWPLW